MFALPSWVSFKLAKMRSTTLVWQGWIEMLVPPLFLAAVLALAALDVSPAIVGIAAALVLAGVGVGWFFAWRSAAVPGAPVAIRWRLATYEHGDSIVGGVGAGAALALVVAASQAGLFLPVLQVVAAATLAGLAAETVHRFVPAAGLRQGLFLVLAIALDVALELTFAAAGQTASLRLGAASLAVVPLVLAGMLLARARDSEWWAAVACVALAVGLRHVLPLEWHTSALLAAIGTFLIYAQMVHRNWVARKHVWRGQAWEAANQAPPALLAYRAALAAAPRANAARQGMWSVHRRLDVQQLLNDPQTRALIDVDLCLKRARDLLLAAAPPTPEQLEEALKLLNLTLHERPTWRPIVDYWRAVAHTHAREFDKAAADLRSILVDQASAPDAAEALVPAWQLALMQHSELRRRVGQPLLAEGHRLAAIAAVEQALEERPDDAEAWALKRRLYADLTPMEYTAAAGEAFARKLERFDYRHCFEQGRAILADPGQWRRGVELIRIAAQGEPAKAPLVYGLMVEAAELAGDIELARRLDHEIDSLAERLGVAAFSSEAKDAYFTRLQQRADRAFQANQITDAIRLYERYLESPNSGVATSARLAELYERQADVVNALIANERCLVYAAKNAEFLERRDRYYYSITREMMDSQGDRLRKHLDVAYCLNKAKSLLDLKNGGAEQVDWAEHLATLAAWVQPENVAAQVALGRAAARRGDMAAARAHWEKAYAAKDRSPQGDDKEAWYQACRLLGDLYLHDDRPDLAVACLAEYRQSPKSGAETLFKLGQAHERLGDPARARKYYDQVTVYDHPLASEAYTALQRLPSS
jgi:tetratricopeptide (TPR) repeat protein